MKKICFVSRGLKAGGMERAMTSFANYLAENGYVVTIVCLFRTDSFFPLNENIKVYWPKLNRKSFSRLVYAALVFPHIRGKINLVKPDIIVSYGEWFNPYVLLVTRGLNIPVYVFDRMGPDLNLGLLLGQAKKYLYGFSAGVVVQTKLAAEKVSQRTKATRIEVIPNALNPVNVIKRSRNKQIVSVGRLEKEKGNIILLTSFALIKSSDWTLHYVGDGPEKENLLQEANHLGIQDRVIFHGFKNDFTKVLAESEIFVLSSYYEGFPNALIEAMSVPLCCISSDCVAGPRDIISHGINGFLFEPGNYTQLSELINELISDPERMIKVETEAYKIREKLEFKKITKRYLEFIEGAQAGPKKSQ